MRVGERASAGAAGETLFIFTSAPGRRYGSRSEEIGDHRISRGQEVTLISEDK